MRQHFGDNFGTANTISYLGTLIGGMVIPFLAAVLCKTYGLQGTLLCLGGLFLNSVPIGAAFRPPRTWRRPVDEKESSRLVGESVDDTNAVQNVPDNELEFDKGDGQQENAEKDSKRAAKPELGKMTTFWRTFLNYLNRAFDITALKSEPFFAITFLPCLMLLDTVFFGWTLFMVSYAISVGQTETFAVYLPITGAAGGLVSRTTLALLLRLKPHSSPEMYAILVTISAASLFSYGSESHLGHMLASSFFAGFGIYGSASTYYAIISVTVSEDNFPGIIAISFFISGIGAVSAGALAGM